MLVRSLGALLLVLLFGSGLVGCGREGDSAFQKAVGPVLSETAALESVINQPVPEPPRGLAGLNHSTVEIETARAKDAAKVYQRHVEGLPEPETRQLRYLRVKLVGLGRATLTFAEAQSRAHQAMAPAEPGKLIDWIRNLHGSSRWEGVVRARFLDALLEASAAERVALGTEVLPDTHPPDEVPGVSAGWTRDTLVQMEREVRREAREMP
jgi:hypothetical protein